jgi:pyruvate/2-oxoglutarate dehydrogenase complex dihydrolipoamide dehydrogenase (E3) component
METGVAELLRPDICVIGAGSGGLSVAAAAAAFGAPVVLIEKGRMGGDCLNFGCIPSKALIESGIRAQQIATADAFGIAARPTIDFARVYRHVHDVIAELAPNDSTERFTGLGVHVIAGTARFEDAETIAVNDGVRIKARRFVIATGSSPAVPSIPGLTETPYFTNETVFGLAQRPSHLMIIGAGPIGLELAQAFRRLGSRVTVIEALRPLAKEDPECSRIVIDALSREDIIIHSAAAVRSVRGAAGSLEVSVKIGETEKTISGDRILVAAGRIPNLEGLGLEAAGIECGPKGIIVDHGLRTTNRRVYAIGDVVGDLNFTHVANYHAGLVIRSALFRLPVRVSYAAMPWVTFTDPELAQVGLTEAQAWQQAYGLRVLRWPFRDNDRARIGRNPGGLVKVITGKRGRTLGATIVGAHAGELIAPWTLAIRQGLNIRAMAEVVSPYPTLGEANKRAAMTYFSPSLTSPRVRRVIGWLRCLG